MSEVFYHGKKIELTDKLEPGELELDLITKDDLEFIKEDFDDSIESDEELYNETD